MAHTRFSRERHLAWMHHEGTAVVLEHLTRKRAEFDLASLELDAGIRAWLIEDQEACLVMVAAEDVPAAQVFLFGQQTGWLHSRVGRPRSRDRD